jgi:hypothetical protein
METAKFIDLFYLIDDFILTLLAVLGRENIITWPNFGPEIMFSVMQDANI